MAQQGQVKASEYATLQGTNMTPKQRMFVKEYVNTLNATEAVMKSYDVSSRHGARSIASENLAKLAEPISRIMDRKGLTDDKLIDHLKDKLTCTKPVISNGKVYQTPDNNTQLKALEIAAKLKNLFPKDTLEVTGKDGGELVIRIKEDRELIEYREGELVDEEE